MLPIYARLETGASGESFCRRGHGLDWLLLQGAGIADSCGNFHEYIIGSTIRKHAKFR